MAEPFSFQIDSPKLIRGLRPSLRVPRDSGYLVKCAGGVGRDGSLQVLDVITRMATTAITAAFPYPQLFMFSELIIVCSPTVIYEWVSGSLVSKLTVTTGSPWTAIDYHGFIYMSNGVVAVTRTAGGVYAISSTLPVAQALIDVHGQVMAGGYL